MHLLVVFLLGCMLMSKAMANADYSALWEDEQQLTYDDLVVDVKGYKVPTRAAFRGWVLLNNAEKPLREIADQLIEAGVTEVPGKTMPMHLILLQGTNWALNNTSIFTLPKQENIPNMVRTVTFIQQHVEPVIGPVIPVSGERSSIYNETSGGAPASKHLDFCALDLVPVQDHSREQLHKMLWSIYNKAGKDANMGLGLYSGVRFHIDTCGFRNW